MNDKIKFIKHKVLYKMLINRHADIREVLIIFDNDNLKVPRLRAKLNKELDFINRGILIK